MRTSLIIRPAVTPAEFEAAYRLRMGEVGFPVHNLSQVDGQFKDKLDVEGVTLLVAKAGEEVVGTVRLVPRRITPWHWEDECNWESLSQLLQLPVAHIQMATGYVSSGVVHPDWRGCGVMKSLLDELDCCALAQNVYYILGIVRDGHEDAVPLMRKRGYMPYHRVELEVGGEGVGITFWQNRLDIQNA